MQVIKLQHRGVMLTSYCDVVNYLLKMYATNEQISAADQAMDAYMQPERMTPTAYGKPMSTKAYRGGTLYEEKRIKSLLLEGLH